MSVLPIYNSLNLVRFAIVPALDALTTSTVAWWVAPQTAARPFVVVQSQDAGGIATNRLNSLGWSGLITVKAVADTIGQAETLLATVAPGMDNLAAPTGYDLSVRYTRAISLGPDNGSLWQVGHVWEVVLERE